MTDVSCLRQNTCSLWSFHDWWKIQKKLLNSARLCTGKISYRQLFSLTSCLLKLHWTAISNLSKAFIWHWIHLTVHVNVFFVEYYQIFLGMLFVCFWGWMKKYHCIIIIIVIITVIIDIIISSGGKCNDLAHPKPGSLNKEKSKFF